jgi:hypothetical protein
MSPVLGQIYAPFYIRSSKIRHENEILKANEPTPYV